MTGIWKCLLMPGFSSWNNVIYSTYPRPVTTTRQASGKTLLIINDLTGTKDWTGLLISFYIHAFPRKRLNLNLRTA